MAWNPELYGKFQKERFVPFEDLSGLVEIREGMDVIDLGCGTGELTERLSDMLPGSRVLGIDSSPEMLGKAAPRVRPGLDFELLPVQDAGGEWDLVFSNAALQWVPDHGKLVPRLISLLKPGGQIAVQVPSNHVHITQRLAGETAGEEPFRSALGGWLRIPSVLTITEYAELLYENGCAGVTVFEKVFPHVLDDARAVLEWLSGTVLLSYFSRLQPPLDEAFRNALMEKLEKLYPEGPVFYPFRRIFFSGFRGRRPD
ncbi:MAG TPA: methyltransferase domain-containing protein [Thermodesulfobacteriota bacterium]|nr:methyltransferase domain-containing protein [Thermodesulfobacteriota bacterium]